MDATEETDEGKRMALRSPITLKLIPLTLTRATGAEVGMDMANETPKL